MSAELQLSFMPFALEEEAQRLGISDKGLLEIAKQTGFRGVEPFVDDKRFLNPDFTVNLVAVGNYRKMVTDLEMKVPVVVSLCDLVSTPSNHQEANERKVMSAIWIADRLGAKRVLVAGHGFAGTGTKNVNQRVGRLMIAESLSRLSRYAEKFGVTLMIEPFGLTPELLCHSRDVLEVCDRSCVKVCLDTGNPFFAGETSTEALTAFVGRISHVHLKDWVKVDKGSEGAISSKHISVWSCPIGEGFVKNKEIMRTLIRDGYNGWFSFEPPICGPGEKDPRIILPRDFLAIRNYLG